MAEMEIKVGADVAGAVAGLNELQTELSQAGKGATQFGTDVQKAGTKVLQLPRVTNQATFTLNKIGRAHV